MRYLKRFNEELSPKLLKKASDKLKKLGHERRAGEMDKYRDIQMKKSELEKWKENVDKYSQYGKIKLRMSKYTSGSVKKGVELLTGEFYTYCIFDDYVVMDSISYDKEQNKNNFNIPIPIMIGAIPIDEETLDLCDTKLPEKTSDGIFWALWISINYKVEMGELHFNGIKIAAYDQGLSGEVEVVDRRGIVLIKNLLKTFFSEDKEYPSGYTDIPNMYDKISQVLCQRLELGIDYNFTMERVLNDINSVTINSLYKD